MLNIIQKNRLLQAIIWLSLLILLVLSAVASEHENDINYQIEDFLIIGWIWLNMMAASYSALYLHSRLFQKQLYSYFVGSLLMILAGIVFVFRGGAGLLLNDFFVQSFISDLVSFSFVMSISIGMRYAKKGLLDQYILKEMQTQLLKAELGALKSQINPHFLFNTLNNIYGINLKDPEKGSEMILSLSEIFRYFLEAQKHEKVTLAEELELIRNYTALERMRLTPTNRLDFKVVAANPNRLIPPLLLMPLVENAVKYGVSPTNETTIIIDIQQGEHEIAITTLNDVHANHRIPSTRIGLKNLKERLDRIYPGRYTLQSLEKDGKWQAKLVIPI